MNRPAPSRQGRGAEPAPRRPTADGAGKALLFCVLLAAVVLAAGRWRASSLAVRADAAEPPPVAVAAAPPPSDSSPDAKPLAGRSHDASRFRIDPALSTALDSIAAERDTELVVCLLDAGTMVVPRQSVVPPLGVRLEEDCPPESFALWHNHPASAAPQRAACSLSTMDIGLILRMQPRWAIVQAQHGQRCWWSYGQVVQHTLISREMLAPVDTQHARTRAR